jgi:hypothetical protein
VQDGRHGLLQGVRDRLLAERSEQMGDQGRMMIGADQAPRLPARSRERMRIS